MVPREVRKEPHAGKRFWGCSKYPECREVISQVICFKINNKDVSASL
jgi:ssDNA-binding Zn-finger/Zn-ribbon topoisomerase 1